METSGKGRACAPFILPLDTAARTLRQVQDIKLAGRSVKGALPM